MILRNFFRPVSLVVAVVLCLLYGLPVVSASGSDDLLEPVYSLEPDSVGSLGPEDSLDPGLGLVESALVSGSDVRVEFQNNSMLSVPSAVPDGGEESLSRSSSSDADGNVQSVLSALFGSYTPRMQTVTTYFNGEVVSTEEQVIPGVAGLDFEWLASVGLFSLMLWCLFRFLGGLFKHG